jgi:hypothetical protein
MRVEAEAAWHLGMLVDLYVPGANFVNGHVVEVKREAEEALLQLL